MSELFSADFRHPRRHVRLDTILRLRWLAALGQLAAIFVVAVVSIIPAVNFSGLLVPVSSLSPIGRLIGLAFPSSWFQSVNPLVVIAFAPVFALLHSGVVALALRQLWRSGERVEAIRVGEAVVEVFGAASVPTSVSVAAVLPIVMLLVKLEVVT